jgi:phage tail sheath protein FI
MPEYLSPGVYIEEVPVTPALEGVSTSTAAFVGRADRGTVPGYVWKGSGTPTLPFTPTGGFVLSPDRAPVLVTSYADFRRQFGPPLPLPNPSDPTDYGYLAYAVKAFFDNGGKRVYIARIVDDGASPSTVRVAQGVVYRLLRPGAKTDQQLFLTSTRGLNSGNSITFFRHSDGQMATGAPAQAAVATGTSGPFALKDGDQLDVKTNTPAATASAPIVAKPAQVETKVSATFGVNEGDTLQIRIGPSTQPVQNVVFSSQDPLAPITSGAATLAQIEAVLQNYVSGVNVSQSGGAVAVATQVQGTAARIEIVAGTALTALGLTTGVTGPHVGSTVADVSQVTPAELKGLLVSANFTVDTDLAGRLRFTTTATGGTVTITLEEVPPGSGLLQALGFGSGSTVTASGSDAIPSALTISAYDSQSNSIFFAKQIGAALDPTDVYGIVSNPTANAGPQFVARDPGAWSSNLQVLVSNSDRQPIPILGAAVIAPGATQLKVQNVSSFYVGAAVEIDYNGTGRSSHQITNVDSGTRQITIDPPTGPKPINPLVTPTPLVRTLEIDITVIDTTGATPTETYRGLAWNQTPNVADVRRHYAWVINANSSLVWVQSPGVGSPTPLSGSEDFTLPTQPTTLDGFPISPSPTNIGLDPAQDAVDPYIGVDNGPGARSGIQSFLDLTDVSIIAAPGKTDQTIQLELIDQCELLRFRFAILDGLDGDLDTSGGAVTKILTHRSLYDTSFAAYYEPWFQVTVDNQTRYLPPSGYMAGIYARVDDARGVWKSPANEIPLNVLGLKVNFTTGEQDILNPQGVNLIRRFDTLGIRVWGARTLSSDTSVMYINVRRTLIFLEATLARGTQWVVFENNTPDTWTRVTDSVTAFLTTMWRSGALFGDTPQQAFFVRCDETTMTPDDIVNGRLICLIGVALVRPAEFVIFRIQQITNLGSTQ